ncbi:MAG TPA: hypothetical protein VHO24_12110 [Opitutaceae bacterium]|nr:hypothetical protein [Opitutaceae bacterium]
MNLQHCSRGLYFDQRLGKGVKDPYHVRASDFYAPQVFPTSRIDDFLRWFISAFDSFRIGLQRDGDGQLKARLMQVAPTVDVVPCDELELAPKNNQTFCLEHAHQIDLLQGETVRAIYYVSAKQGRSVLRILYSHFAVDTQSAALIQDAPRYFMRGADNPPPTFGGYLDWMNTYWTYAVSDKGAEEEGFWSGLQDAFSEATTLGQKCAGAHRHHLQLDVSPDIVWGLMDRARLHWKCPLVDAVMAATSTALGRVYDLGRVPLWWTGHGRSPVGGRRFLNTVGWLSDYHPMVVDCTARTKQERTRDFRLALERLPNAGASFPWVAEFGRIGPAGELRRRLASPFRVNYRQARELPSRRPVSPMASEPPPIPVVTKPDIAPGNLDVYLTIDVGVRSKVSLVLSGDVPATHGDTILRAMHQALREFAVGEDNILSTSDIGLG